VSPWSTLLQRYGRLAAVLGVLAPRLGFRLPVKQRGLLPGLGLRLAFGVGLGLGLRLGTRAVRCARLAGDVIDLIPRPRFRPPLKQRVLLPALGFRLTFGVGLRLVLVLGTPAVPCARLADTQPERAIFILWFTFGLVVGFWLFDMRAWSARLAGDVNDLAPGFGFRLPVKQRVILPGLGFWFAFGVGLGLGLRLGPGTPAVPYARLAGTQPDRAISILRFTFGLMVGFWLFDMPG
jgi:hypothetical protein